MTNTETKNVFNPDGTAFKEGWIINPIAYMNDKGEPDLNIGDTRLWKASDIKKHDHSGGDYAKIKYKNILGMPTLPHLMQSDSTDQAITATTSAQVITFDTDVHHHQFSRTSSSRFTIKKEGSYLICFSGVTMGVINTYIHAWLRKNGTDVPASNTIYQYKSNNATTVVAVSFIEHFLENDYFEFWTWGNSTSNKWDATAAYSGTVNRPACPSIIITANYVGAD
jgi:hypothetical protein